MADQSENQEGSNEPAPHPQPLDYGTPAPSDTAMKVVSTLAGGIVAIVLVAFFGAVAYPYDIGGPGPPAAQKVQWAGVAVFLCLALAGIVGAVLLWRRRPLGQGVWFFAGALIGIGITCLLEGACYASP